MKGADSQIESPVRCPLFNNVNTIYAARTGDKSVAPASKAQTTVSSSSLTLLCSSASNIIVHQDRRRSILRVSMQIRG